jgi:hypothetical protein
MKMSINLSEVQHDNPFVPFFEVPGLKKPSILALYVLRVCDGHHHLLYSPIGKKDFQL